MFDSRYHTKNSYLLYCQENICRALGDEKYSIYARESLKGRVEKAMGKYGGKECRDLYLLKYFKIKLNINTWRLCKRSQRSRVLQSLVKMTNSIRSFSIIRIIVDSKFPIHSGVFHLRAVVTDNVNRHDKAACKMNATAK